MVIETITPAEATEQLRALGLKISTEVLRDGIDQGKFPFGVSIKSRHGGTVYHIYKRQFDAWVSERASK